ncbi:MAG: hypothetical protein HKN47_26490 [Pirellulaceae bacterium]|nr:hypothetical protein [Pirellulaceae bacterium]
MKMPLPVRWRNGAMEPESISFDGTTIRIRYHKRQGTTRGWYDGAAIHQIDWLKELRTGDDVAAHHRREHDNATFDRTPLVKCGAGQRTRFSRPGETGGRAAIYLISENGDHGSLRVWSNHFQRYDMRKFKVGSVGQWPDLLELTPSPITMGKSSGR